MVYILLYSILLIGADHEMTFSELMIRFPTEKSAIRYYTKVRYPSGIRCNHCGSSKVYQEKKRIKIFSCNDCKGTFSIFKGTAFEKSSTDFRKWLYIIHQFSNNNKNLSAFQLQHELNITYKTAWRMLRQIRLSLDDNKQ